MLIRWAYRGVIFYEDGSVAKGHLNQEWCVVDGAIYLKRTEDVWQLSNDKQKLFSNWQEAYQEALVNHLIFLEPEPEDTV